MNRVFVETSGENTPLAVAEAIAAAEALGGGAAPGPEAPGLVEVELPAGRSGSELAARLALAHRCVELRAAGNAIASWLERCGRNGGSAAVRRLGRPSSGGSDPAVLAAGRAFASTGGRIDLERPEHRFWLQGDRGAGERLFEETAAVDRRAASGRRMPTLPFQRPVSLAPRLARAAANLARVRPGDRVVDPFVGTGALLAEAGLLGARLYGVDRDPEMVRGTLRNLAHLGVTAEELVVGDAGSIDFVAPPDSFDAVLTDPPYGRASSTGGESSAGVVARVLPRWARRVRPGGRVVAVTPGPIEAPGPEWIEVLAVPMRVHRSLTRQFRVFERSDATPSSS